MDATRFSVLHAPLFETPSQPPKLANQSPSYVDSIWLPSSAFASKISPTQKVVETIPVCSGYLLLPPALEPVAGVVVEALGVDDGFVEGEVDGASVAMGCELCLSDEVLLCFFVEGFLVGVAVGLAAVGLAAVGTRTPESDESECDEPECVGFFIDARSVGAEPAVNVQVMTSATKAAPADHELTGWPRSHLRTERIKKFPYRYAP